MTNNIELLSSYDNFTIGTNNNLTEILANVVKVGTDTSNVTFSIPQDISSSYNLILPARQGASGESLVYSSDGQLVWHDPTVLKQVISVYGSNLSSNLVSTGIHGTPTYLDNYIASITPKSSNSKIFVQFKVNYHASLSVSNQISFYIKKTHDGNETIFSESLFGPYNAAGGFTGQYISNLIDQSSSTNTISYQLGYQINGNVAIDDVVGILGYDSSYNNSILLQEFQGSGTTAVSLWDKGSDSNGLYYNEGTVHIGSTKNALDSVNTPGVALELSGNLLGNHATFSGNIIAHAITVEEGYFGPNTLYINGQPILNEDSNGNRIMNTDIITSDNSNNGLIIKTSNNGNIVLDPSGSGIIKLNDNVELLGNLTCESIIGNLTGTMTMTGHILPDTNSTYDIGSAEYKIRDLYLSNNSLWIGDQHKATINSNTNQLEFKKRKTDGIPHSFRSQGKTNEQEIYDAVGVASLSNMTLGKWKQAARLLNVPINGIVGENIDANYIFDVTESSDWDSSIDINTLYQQVGTLENKVPQSVGPTDNVQFNDISCANISLTNNLTLSGNLTLNSATTFNDLNISGRMIMAIADEPSTEELNAKPVNSGVFYKTSDSLRMVIKSDVNVFKYLLINNSGIDNIGININGDNPATVNKNDNYVDAGATLTGAAVNLQTTVNVDTSIVGTNNTVIYTANDNTGNIIKVIRYVNVV